MNEELVIAQQRQLDHLENLEREGESAGGWKLGLTSGESRDAFGPGIRPFGFILASRILASDAGLDWSRIGNGGIENELCFRIGEDITSTVTADSVRQALESVAPAFEINQRRIEKTSSPAERIADDLANWGIVVGTDSEIPADPDWDAMTVTLCHDGEPVERVAAAGHIDNHFQSLATLANALQRFGRHLKKGDRVITGAFGKQAQPHSGTWSGDFGPELGTVLLDIEN